MSSSSLGRDGRRDWIGRLRRVWRGGQDTALGGKESDVERRRAIGNVNVLDLRNATSESVAEVKEVGNVNVAIFTRETARLLQELSIGNLNASAEVPSGADVTFVDGRSQITRDGLRNAAIPKHMVVLGKALIHPDVTADDLQRGLASLTVVGQLVCPDPLSSAVQTGGSRVVGKTVVYPPLRHVEWSSLVLDKARAEALADRDELAVIGTVRIVEDVPADLLARKLEKLFASSGIVCYPQHTRTLGEIVLPGSGEITVIPEGHRFVEESLELSRTTLENLTDGRLYCVGSVTVVSDVEAPLLEKKLKHLVVKKETLFYPKALAAALARICDLLGTDSIPYEGKLWVVEGADRLRASRLDLQKEKVTLHVTGQLAIDADVAPKALLDRLARIHNFGVIRCTREQAGAVEELLGIRQGVIDDGSGESEEGDDSNLWLANANYLAV